MKTEVRTVVGREGGGERRACSVNPDLSYDWGGRRRQKQLQDNTWYEQKTKNEMAKKYLCGFFNKATLCTHSSTSLCKWRAESTCSAFLHLWLYGRLPLYRITCLRLANANEKLMRMSTADGLNNNREHMPQLVSSRRRDVAEIFCFDCSVKN